MLHLALNLPQVVSFLPWPRQEDQWPGLRPRSPVLPCTKVLLRGHLARLHHTVASLPGVVCTTSHQLLWAGQGPEGQRCTKAHDLRTGGQALLYWNPRQVRGPHERVLRLCQRTFSPGGHTLFAGLLHGRCLRDATLCPPTCPGSVLQALDQPLPPRWPSSPCHLCPASTLPNA